MKQGLTDHQKVTLYGGFERQKQAKANATRVDTYDREKVERRRKIEDLLIAKELEAEFQL